MQTPSFEQSVLEALRALSARNQQVVLTQFILADGSMCQVFPPRGSTAPAPPPSPPPEDCRDAIIQTLREVGRRLTTTQIMTELLRRGHEYGERRVSGVLSQLVAEGILTNPKERGRHAGYGLPSENP